jgi:voltage-gated sodium channel
MITLEQQLIERLANQGAAPWRTRLARWIESPRVVQFIIGVILVNAVILGLETNKDLMARSGTLLIAIDRACLAVFIIEIVCKLLAFRGLFWRSGWNIFDFIVVAVALVPGAGPWAVIRSLRVLRVLRLLTMIPSLRKVVAAFLHAIPGLGGVLLLMVIFLYTSAGLAVNLFGQRFPEWFGTLTGSLFSLFQILTLEGWADMARAIMEVYPWAPLFFVPFIIIATFTVLNLFIGIIVNTMQELSTLPEPGVPKKDLAEALARIEGDIKGLRNQIENEGRDAPSTFGGDR